MKRLSLFIFFLVWGIQANNLFDNKLLEAVKNRELQNRPNLVDKLLEQGANPNVQENGKTAIMYLIENLSDRVDTFVLQKLLERAKKLNTIDLIAGNGMTAFTFAADLGNMTAIEELSRFEADASIKDAFDRTVQDYLQDNLKLSYKQRELNRKQRELARKNAELDRDIQEFEEINIPEEEWTEINIGKE